jgi:hypothetical protein
MAVFRKEEFMWGDKLISSDTILGRLVADLKDRFPRTQVRRDKLAAAIDFGGSKLSLDVVPAIFKSFHLARPVYLIPNGKGGWLETSPATHDRYFAKEQARSGNKLRRVSQLLKWWRHGRQQPIPISSFYVDMILASQQMCGGVKSYATCLLEFFQFLDHHKCPSLIDPCGVAGRITATPTFAQREALTRAVSYARMHAELALAWEAKRNHAEANHQWSLVFNDTY